jgi:parvulin-like peptidyl-prolyl isomerase
MKSFCVLALLSLAAACAQTAPAPAKTAPAAPVNLDPETVIATFGDGLKLTHREMEIFLSLLPPQMQQGAMRDKKAFVQQFALMVKLAAAAEKAKLDTQSPTKETLYLHRMQVLSTAQLNEAYKDIPVDAAEQQKFYEANKDRYAQVKVKVIYVSFAANPQATPPAGGKKYLSEAEAKAKMEKIRAQAISGTDFVKLVKENSEDQTSKDKDGDFGSIRRSDNIPETIRSVIFKLKPGEISEIVRQPNGFYVFRAEEVGARPYTEVRDEIFNEIKQQRFQKWMEELNRDLNLKIVNEAYFAATAPAAPPTAPAASPTAPAAPPK